MYQVIVLTANHQFWGERPLKDVLRLYFRGKIEIVKAEEGKYIHAGMSRDGITFKMPAPLIVRLLNFFGYKYKKDRIAYSDEAVYRRDNNICQYWHYNNGKKFKYRCTMDELTIDHIVPSSKGGNTSFDNCVCACRNCNEVIKRNRTPHEAGLELIRKPFEPAHRKGDWVVMTFTFNPHSRAHQAYYEYMGMKFSHVV